MQQIADRLHVSKYTVSQALAGKGGVSEATRQRVMETARAMGYEAPSARAALGANGFDPAHARPAAQGQAEADGRYVVVWMSRIHQEEPMYWQRVLGGIQEACREHGWGAVVLAPFDDGQAADILPPYLDRTRCVGGLAVGAFPLKQLAAMKRIGVPVVLVDHQEPFSGLDSVANDNIAAARMISGLLLDKGCRSFVFVGSDRFSVSFRERWLGCRSALEQTFAQRKDGELRRWTIPYSREWIEALQARVARIRAEELPDAFICANDDIAAELLKLLQQRGIDVPGRCRVAGIDNIEGSAWTRPPLTTMDLGKEQLGQRAVEALERRSARPAAPVERVGLVPELVLRAST
ncbi:LacI family transcriptional regulator [Paenibacillus albicereus]|uniref:LacI family transcriptional regulator n=1 Tax=Paenibacillus albicereus TaxID=2726185 RepID=A0A6H2GWL9_9BACL|nr:LacI family DNA-binding transcriptional regulator [Paenibacillus albicereus]QJC51566.1 LacI family transcriptional regulator [Paenibacillus albicereus]